MQAQQPTLETQKSPENMSTKHIEQQGSQVRYAHIRPNLVKVGTCEG
jgi:hypothetical protein